MPTGCRVRAGHAAENFAVMRHIAVNLLKAVEGGLDGKKLGGVRLHHGGKNS